jgi:hypothetical protein
MAGRVGVAMPVSNEGAGVVIAAGKDRKPSLAVHVFSNCAAKGHGFFLGVTKTQASSLGSRMMVTIASRGKSTV